MHWGWITSPLAVYGMLAAGLVASLMLFLTVKLEICGVMRRVEESGNAVSNRLRETEVVVEELRETTAGAGDRQLAGLSSLNLTRRAQAVRMYRRGEPVATIAAALGAPRNEIELLIKLHEMQRQGAS
jgi:hypothetical protein